MKDDLLGRDARRTHLENLEDLANLEEPTIEQLDNLGYLLRAFKLWGLAIKVYERVAIGATEGSEAHQRAHRELFCLKLSLGLQEEAQENIGQIIRNASFENYFLYDLAEDHYRNWNAYNERVAERERLEQTIVDELGKSVREELAKLAGCSNNILNALRTAFNASKGDKPVLIHGSTGTGKTVSPKRTIYIGLY